MRGDLSEWQIMADTDSLSDKEVLARTIYGEARGESRTGKQAIASIILNRAKHGGWWGNDIRSCALKPYQFSCWNKSDPNRSVIMEVTDADPVFTQCLDIAELAVNGILYDVVDGADSYYAKGTPTPKWAKPLTPWVEIGHHLFFRTV